MHIILGIVGLILIATFWDQVVYLFGGGLIIIALFSAILCFMAFKESNMSNEEYLEQENKKKQSNQNYNIKNKQKEQLFFFLSLQFYQD